MFDVEKLIQSGGLLLIGAMVFAESGLLIGFFLPGDTLLFTAGFFASQGNLNLPLLLIVIAVAAVVGDNVGYSLGRRTGHRVFRKKDGILFRQEHLVRAEKFYEDHGGKTIIIARFVPIVRTFAPVVAGAAKMDRKRFFIYNMIGAIVWGVGITMLGFWLGNTVPNIEKYIVPAVVLATVLTFGPALWHILKDPITRAKLSFAIKHSIKKTLNRIGLNKNIDI